MYNFYFYYKKVKIYNKNKYLLNLILSAGPAGYLQISAERVQVYNFSFVGYADQKFE